MKAALVIAAREIAERRIVLVAALVAGLVPFLGPLIPGARDGGAGEAQAAMAAVLAAGFALVCALLLGAGAVGRDLSEGRIGFDFSRPVPAGAIWAGRLGGALVLTLLSFAAALLPTLLASLAGGFRSLAWILHGPRTLGFLALLAVLVPLAHALGIAFRSRSVWLALDFIAGAVVLCTVAAVARALLGTGAIQVAMLAGTVLIGSFGAALWVGSAVQVARGRADIRAGHRAMSFAFWTTLAACALGFAGFTLWFTAVGPEDLRVVWAAVPPDGRWVIAQGGARRRGDFEPAFLIDTTSGRNVRLDLSPGGFYSAAFSDDGRRAVWVRWSGLGAARWEIVYYDLEESEPQAVDTTLSTEKEWSDVALSPDGRLLASFNGGSLTVLRLPGEGTALAMRVFKEQAADSHSWVGFASDDRLFVYRASGRDRTRLEIVEVDLASRSASPAREVAVPVYYPWFQASHDHSRLLVRSDETPPRHLLIDTGTGAILADLTPPWISWSRRARFLGDGRFAIAETHDRVARLHLYSASGQEEKMITVGTDGDNSVGTSGEVALGGEIERGQLVLAVGKFESLLDRNAKILAVDLETGTVRRLGEGMVPLLFRWSAVLDNASQPGSVATRLFYRGPTLVLLDPKTGEERWIAGPALQAGPGRKPDSAGRAQVAG